MQSDASVDKGRYEAGELVLSYHELASQSSLDELIFDTEFAYPTTPDAVVGGHSYIPMRLWQLR